MRFAALLLLCAVLGGCASLSNTYPINTSRWGNLVDDWYEGPEAKDATKWPPSGELYHMCKYENGIILNAGRTPRCP